IGANLVDHPTKLQAGRDGLDSLWLHLLLDCPVAGEHGTGSAGKAAIAGRCNGTECVVALGPELDASDRVPTSPQRQHATPDPNRPVARCVARRHVTGVDTRSDFSGTTDGRATSRPG